MSARRVVLSLILALTATTAARGQTYLLSEGPLAGSCYRLELRMNLAGQMTVRQNGKDLALKQSAEARHEFLERVLKTAPTGLVDQAARFYKDAQATITVAGESSSRKLRADRTFLVAHRHGDQVVTYCPKGLLTGAEFELTEHFDTLALPGLLPGKEVTIGDSWKLTNAAAQALCDIDGLVGHDLAGTLEKVEAGLAHLAVTGTANGIDLGAAVKLTIRAGVHFDLKARRVVALVWQQNDDREAGPVSPALKAQITTTLKRTPIEQPKELHDFVLVQVPDAKTPPESLTQIVYTDAKGRFELSHARDWHLVGRTDEHVVFRLLDRGDFVAQASIAPWKKADPGKHLTPKEFKAAMDRAPGWEPEKVVDQSEVGADVKDLKICRLAATGTLDGVEAVQYFYLVAGPQGEQTVLTFTMTPTQAQKLDPRDLLLVRSLRYP